MHAGTLLTHLRRRHSTDLHDDVLGTSRTHVARRPGPLLSRRLKAALLGDLAGIAARSSRSRLRLGFRCRDWRLTLPPALPFRAEG